MTQISIIAAVDEAGGLGLNNQLLCHLPADLKHFKEVTMGKPIMMGRTTYESIGKPLPGRLNIVLSKTLTCIEGVLVFDSLEEALNQVQDVPELMIIGGAKLYDQTLDMANRIYLTQIHHTFQADAFFPKMDEKLWSCQNTQFLAKDEKNLYDMTFCFYEKNSF